MANTSLHCLANERSHQASGGQEGPLLGTSVEMARLHDTLSGDRLATHETGQDLAVIMVLELTVYNPRKLIFSPVDKICLRY